jgi:hypothetical protein
MGLNKNHEVEDFNGVRCAVVEKGISQGRVDFLKKILEYNNYEVHIVPSAPPKATPAAKPVTSELNDPTTAAATATDTAISLFNVGVTDLLFNPINAIFGRLLKNTDGHIVTLAYWHQKESVSNDEIPYFDNR